MISVQGGRYVWAGDACDAGTVERAVCAVWQYPSRRATGRTPVLLPNAVQCIGTIAIT